MKNPTPILMTGRLRLRLPERADAAVVHELAADIRVSRPTLVIPHPYTLAHALKWFDSIRDDFDTGDGHTFLIERLAEPGVIGAIGLHLGTEDRGTASAGYWIGHPFWGQGYASEALREMLRYGFDDLGLDLIEAFHIKENPASGRVMLKAGLRYIGEVYMGCHRDGEFFDRVNYSLGQQKWQSCFLPPLD